MEFGSRSPSQARRRRSLLNFTLLTILACSRFGTVLAQDTPKDAEPVAPPGPEPTLDARLPWNPPPPAEDDFDWVRMGSGEWLKGDIDSLRHGRIFFDSDQFDMQELDLDDVVELRSPRTNTVLLDDRSVLRGTLHLVDDRLIVGSDEGPRIVARDDINSIVPGDAVDRGVWSGKISYGFTAREGNNDQNDTNLFAEVLRRTAATRWRATYNGSTANVNGDEVANNHRAVGSYDYFVTTRLFWRVGFVEYYEDRFQNIDYRVQPGTGIGYSVFDDGDLQWTMTAGAAYQYIRYEEVRAGESRNDETATAVVSTSFENSLTSTVDYSFSYALTVPVPETTEWIHNMRVALQTELTENLDFDVAAIWDRVNSPERDINGVQPESDDFRIVIGLGYEF